MCVCVRKELVLEAGTVHPLEEEGRLTKAGASSLWEDEAGHF